MGCGRQMSVSGSQQAKEKLDPGAGGQVSVLLSFIAERERAQGN